MEPSPIPQFIEQEGKIAAFISFRQFFYIVGAGIFCFILYFVLPRFLFWLLAPTVMIVAVVLAFVQVNGAPLINIIMSSVGFLTGTKDYVWKKEESPYPFKPIQRTKIKKLDTGPVLQAQKSQLKKISTAVELKTK